MKYFHFALAVGMFLPNMVISIFLGLQFFGFFVCFLLLLNISQDNYLSKSGMLYYEHRNMLRRNMLINTNLWRAQIGTFSTIIVKLSIMNTWPSITKAKFQHSFVFPFFFLITFLSLILILFNDIELNAGPKKDSSNQDFQYLIVLKQYCHSKNCQNSQLEDYTTMHSYDLICLYETLRLP